MCVDTPFSFPADFLWGAATAAHQVEGDNRGSDWWAYEASGRLPFASGEACRHFELFASDFDLARSLGHNAHRLSLEWSRIEPEPGRFDDDALAHYDAVLSALRERSIEPVVTLHHFTNPLWFADAGGWLQEDAPRLFARYAAHVAEHLGGHATRWLTLNEPTVYARHAYLFGEWPPMERGAWSSARRCLTRMARAHVAGYRAFKAARPGADVGFAHSAAYLVPCRPRSVRDRLATRIRDAILNAWFLRLIGGARHLDHLGVNYYNRTIVRSRGLGPAALFGRACKEAHHDDLGPLSQTGWEVHPEGLTAVLERYGELGVPLLVTENGLATHDEALRRTHLFEHLSHLALAIQRGVDVRGYFYWSLMDNFEWALGREPAYGLCAVDWETQERRPRPAAEDLARVARANALLPPRES